MKRLAWIALPLAAGAVAIAVAAWRTRDPGPSRADELESRLRRDRLRPQPGPPPAPEKPTLWFAPAEPDWSDPKVREQLLAELCALDELIARGTWSRARDDRERTSALAVEAVLARLGALAAEREERASALPLVVPLLLEDRLLDPAIFAPLWRLYRASIGAELARPGATHAVRLRAWLEHAPPDAAEALALELWEGTDAWWTQPWAPSLVGAIGGARSLERIARRLPQIENPEHLLAWIAAARAISVREGALETHRAALTAQAERAFDAALAMRLADARLEDALESASELSGRPPLELLDERWRTAPPGSPARAQLERLRRRRS